MNNMHYDGFRFKHTRKDANSPNGLLQVHIIAIAGTVEEAKKLAGYIVPEQGLKLIGHGAEVLHAAETVGLRDGQAKVL